MNWGRYHLPASTETPTLWFLFHRGFSPCVCWRRCVALKTHMMKPYSQHGLSADKRIYNYRHSRARRVSENLFGIMANRWRVFHTILMLPPETIEILVMAALILHNYLRRDSLSAPNAYCPTGLIDREDRTRQDHRWKLETRYATNRIFLATPGTIEGPQCIKWCQKYQKYFQRLLLPWRCCRLAVGANLDGLALWEWSVSISVGQYKKVLCTTCGSQITWMFFF